MADRGSGELPLAAWAVMSTTAGSDVPVVYNPFWPLAVPWGDKFELPWGTATGGGPTPPPTTGQIWPRGR